MQILERNTLSFPLCNAYANPRSHVNSSENQRTQETYLTLIEMETGV